MRKHTTLILISMVLLLSACGNNRTFDSASWLKADARTRGRMAEDLVKSKTLIGKSDEQAKRLLGEPDRIYPTALSYQLDLGWPFKDPKHYGLLVHLDQNRSVREVQIVD